LELSIEQKIKYLERRKPDIESLYNSINTRSLCEISQIVHKLKGNGATFGYPEISKISREIEDALLNEKFSLVEIYIQQLEKIVSDELLKLRP
jgi:HPt (histidine-containing phosphotransfer) domain-containing protein